MTNLTETYLAGSQKLRDAVAGMTEAQLDAKPVPDKWSTRQVVCHIADCEIVYADRMKRVIVEDNPAMLNLDPDAFAARLAYDQRDVEVELQLIEATRAHMGRILRALESDQFQRTGQHSTDGPFHSLQLQLPVSESWLSPTTSPVSPTRSLPSLMVLLEHGMLTATLEIRDRRVTLRAAGP